MAWEEIHLEEILSNLLLFGVLCALAGSGACIWRKTAARLCKRPSAKKKKNRKNTPLRWNKDPDGFISPCPELAAFPPLAL